MLSEEDVGMDYDELTLNPLLAEIEAETETDFKKEKQRRYWTPTEEQKFFEIWGRDNWRLTRHGKNTIFFAQWATELKERFDIEVKQEEIQAKVNQTRAKFRQVKKQIKADKNCARWKKFGIIDKILKNQYRPKDAEPIPKEALENNRDIDASEVGSPSPLSPSRSARQSSPTSITSSSNTQEAATNSVSALENNGNAVSMDLSTQNTTDIDIKVEGDYMADSSITTSLFNTTAELFTDPMDEVKAEYPNEYQNYGNYAQANNHFDTPHPTGVDDDEEPQLHTLQTPQQLLQQQHEQQQQHLQQEQYQQYPPTPTATAPPPPDTTTANNNNGQQHIDYDQVVAANTYVVANQGGVPNQNHYAASTTMAASSSTTQQQNSNADYNGPYAANAANTANTNHNSANNAPVAPMQPPTSSGTSGLGRGAPGQPRRRRATPANNALAAGGGESLESMYLNEVRKKNILLAEQLEITRKRMQLEERKVNLLERFFPKCLEMQEQILGKLNAGGGNT